MLTLPQELALLALDPDSGSLSHSRLAYALSGAVLAELLLSRRIHLDAGRIACAALPPPEDAAQSSALQLIRASSRERDVRHWVQRLGGNAGLMRLVIDSLIELHVIQRETHQFLVFHYDRYRLTPSGTRDTLCANLLRTLTQAGHAEERAQMLAALAGAGGLVQRALGKEHWRQVKPEAERLARNFPVSAAVIHVAEDEEAAAVAAVTATF